MFVCALIVAFFLGALNAARAEALQERQVNSLLGLSISDLTQVILL